jgi:hypothetical protein
MIEVTDEIEHDNIAAVQGIADLYTIHFGDPADDGFSDRLDEVSDDASLQFFRDARMSCESHGVPEDEYVDVILDGMRLVFRRQTEEMLSDLRYNMELIFSL